MGRRLSYSHTQAAGTLWLGVAAVAFLLAGCSGSAPRFKSGKSEAGRVVQEDAEFRFAAKVKAEEAREDDKKVDLEKLRKRLSSRSLSSTYSNRTPDHLNRDQVLLTVVSYLGVPYAFGKSNKEGIDCSGFTSNVYAAAAGKPLPRSTADQFHSGKDVSKGDLQFGDLVFFNTTGRGPSHVGIYIEDDLFAHASVSSGVTFSSLESTYFKKRFVGARRMAE